jgi:cysteine synthase A
MPEIVASLGADIDYVFISTSTCGPLRGCADYLRRRKLKTKIVAVDAECSAIFGRPVGKRLLPGHGAGIVSPLFRNDLATTVVFVSDLDCVIGFRRLVRQEAILTGASSGGVVTAIERLASEGTLERGATCAAIFPERGERYLDTVNSDAWVQERLGVDALSI